MNKAIFIILLIITSVFSNVQAQNSNKMKAMFLYSFLKYVDFPKDTKKENFVIGILGSSKVSKELKQIAKIKKVAGKKIIIKEYISISDIYACHILFIPENKNNSLKDVLKQIKDKNVLLVADKKNAVKNGASINFYVKGKRISFQICEKNIKKNGLKVLSALLVLGDKKC